MIFAMLGGSFDPVHVGHLFMADEVMAQCGYDRIVFVPANVAPHKAGPGASARHRVRMLEIALAGAGSFGLERYETERPGPSFTIDTVRHLISTLEPDGRPGLIIGSDLVDGFDNWREPDAIEALARIVVVRRPGIDHSDFARDHRTVENSEIGISSSDIRSRVRENRPYRYLVPRGVAEYIEENGLYR